MKIMKKELFPVLVSLLLAVSLLLSACTDIGQPQDSTDSGSVSQESHISSEAEESFPVSSDEEQSSGEESGASSSDESRPEEKKVVSFLACPDNIIHPSVYYNAIQTAADKKGVKPDYYNLNLQTADYEFAPMYDNIKELIKNADLSYINVETLIGGNENPISGYPMFNSPEKAGETLLDLGFDIYNLAHNHMLDSGDDRYLINCNRFFKERGVQTIGYYENKEDTNNIVVVEK